MNRWCGSRGRAFCLPNRFPGNRGFSLIEVVMATAFLMGSAIVLSKLAGMGRDQAQKARLQMSAQEMCEQTLNELLLGLRPFEVTEGTPLLALPEPIAEENESFEADQPLAGLIADRPQAAEANVDSRSAWNHSIRLEALPGKPGMWSVTVVVIQAEAAGATPARFSLTRWIAGPPPEGALEELLPEGPEPSAGFGGASP